MTDSRLLIAANRLPVTVRVNGAGIDTVPSTFVRRNSPGPSIDRSTCDSAARCMIPLGRKSRNNCRTASVSQMSIGAKV